MNKKSLLTLIGLVTLVSSGLAFAPAADAHGYGYGCDNWSVRRAEVRAIQHDRFERQMAFDSYHPVLSTLMRVL